MASNAANVFKRAQRGLYGGKTILSGNHVSFSNKKTRRTWLPNVQSKKLYSELLEKPVPLRLTTYVLRWVDKVGGLDNYLLATPERKLQSKLGSELKAELRAKYFEKHGVKYDPKPLILAQRAERSARTVVNRAAKEAKKLEIAERDRLAAERAAALAAEKAAAAEAAAAARAAKAAKAAQAKPKATKKPKDESAAADGESASAAQPSAEAASKPASPSAQPSSPAPDTSAASASEGSKPAAAAAPQPDAKLD
eukprot:TRINITY_DN8806_c0_g1_i2.p2 TRINITY_DN8806_c0_g1~~TRINITY_DN8806_c0_g1_i2.p2  ORF type:complete len:253 (-),score=85.41 TRINITY_DN8806_c0_g1_i2:1701-2459(-)